MWLAGKEHLDSERTAVTPLRKAVTVVRSGS
jgi:hypothetical protein